MQCGEYGHKQISRLHNSRQFFADILPSATPNNIVYCVRRLRYMCILGEHQTFKNEVVKSCVVGPLFLYF